MPLFGNVAQRDGLQEKLQTILGLTTSRSSSDGAPQYICRSCTRIVEAAADLRMKALTNQAWYQRNKKRTKDTSGDGASPFTVQSRTPSKRALPPRRLQMEHEHEQSESISGKKKQIFYEID